MKSLIRWGIHNTPAMNTLMVGILVVGAVSLWAMRREVFPEFELEIILVTVPYPGASPAEVEEGICQKIEEAVRTIDGIKKINSVAGESAGSVILELHAGVPDVQKILNEVRSEIDRIPSFPELAEDPEVKQITLRRAAIYVDVIGPDTDDTDDTDDPGAELALREVAEQIRDEILQLPSVSQADLVGARPYQIDVEISEKTLRKYGLTLQEVARIVRRENVEVPGGSMKTDAQEVLLRGKNKHLVGREIAKIPLVTQPNGVVLSVGDLGTVRDEFTDTTAISRINGKPGLTISVNKTAAEDLLAITEEVKDYLANKQMPPGYSLLTWNDVSVHVRDRLELLGRNGVQGLILVFIVLAVFLEIRLAFWVALGIPISILGACGFMLYAGQTLNMLSMFAFLMALGILVDDAIVVGENVYAHRQKGTSLVEATVGGTYEVLPSVFASVATTIIAFTPLLFVPGIMGKFIAVMPLAVIAMLVVSLVECTFILPCHLAHVRNHNTGDETGDEAERVDHREGSRQRSMLPILWVAGSLVLLLGGLAAVLLIPLPHEWLPYEWLPWIWIGICLIVLTPSLFYLFKGLADMFRWLNVRSNRILRTVITRGYVPTLRWSLNNPMMVLSTAAMVLLLALGCVRAGIIPFVAIPKLDGDMVEARIFYPDGTPSAITDEATKRLEEAIFRLDDMYARQGGRLLKVTHRRVGDVGAGVLQMENEVPGGSHSGTVQVELVGPSERDVTSYQIVKQWRQLAGEFPGTESLAFRSAAMGPGGAAIEFKLLADLDQMAVIEKAVEECKAKLNEYPGVLDIEDDSRPGKWEFQLKIKDKAEAMGVSTADLAGTVRAAYYGEEVMRLQRGRHEVKLMVRYPREERRSLANFNDIRVRTGGGAERPLTELAQVEIQRGYSQINRLNQQRAITITADVDEERANAKKTIADLKENFMPDLLARPEYSDISVRWEGQQEQTDESIAGLLHGLMIALVAMFALLTLEFRSYIQPLLILMIIPFGAVGAIVGHFVMGLPVTLFSLFGMVALTGVVVNDSIVLIDFINRRVRAGMPVKEALLDAGGRRFRPVLLTSLTTIAGLLPILVETSFQAQVLIPMATSLSFGLMFTTLLVLVLVPTFYLLYFRFTQGKSQTPDMVPAIEASEALVGVDDQVGALTHWPTDSAAVGRE